MPKADPGRCFLFLEEKSEKPLPNRITCNVLTNATMYATSVDMEAIQT